MLPDKPEAVKDVSDRLWEAALRKAYSTWKTQAFGFAKTINYPELIDHARCLILLGEVEEPRDPIDEAIEAAHKAYWSASWHTSTTLPVFAEAVRTHLGPFLKGEG